MLFTHNKKLFLENLDQILNTAGKSRNWLNQQVFGKSVKGRARGDLWRSNQKEINLSQAVKAAHIVNKSVDELLSPNKTVEYGRVEPVSYYARSQNKGLDREPQSVNMLLTMAQEILESNTSYSVSLTANIQCFYKAVKNEEKLFQHERRLSALEKKQKRKNTKRKTM